MNGTFYIDGIFRNGADATFDVRSPYDGSVLTTLPSASADDVEAAVRAADRCFRETWRFMEPLRRHDLFLAWADELESDKELARIVAENMGTGVDGPRATAAKIISMIRYYAGLIQTNYGEVLSFTDDHINYVVREPLGVVAAMPPWNSPIESTIQKLAPALAAGNTVVLRLPEEAPLGGIRIIEAMDRAGFPPGAVNMLFGGHESGRRLVAHPLVRLVSFTGSVETGKRIAAVCTEEMKRFVLELGGKSPIVVFEDADLDKVARSAVQNAFAFQGQICCAATRVLVQRSIAKEFSARVAELADSYQLPGGADSADTHPLIGPLFNRKVFETTQRYVSIGRRDGTLISGGEPLERESGFYFRPTIFTFEDDRSPVCHEEIFGPVLAVIPFDTEEEAVRIANDVVYGLAASVWTADRARLFRVIRRLSAGTVWANTYMEFNIHSPWGGTRQSGVGREFGRYAMQPYQEEKAVWIAS